MAIVYLMAHGQAPVNQGNSGPTRRIIILLALYESQVANFICLDWAAIFV